MMGPASGRPSLIRVYRCPAVTALIALAIVPALFFAVHLPSEIASPIATVAAFVIVVAWAFDHGIYGGLIAPIGIFAYYVVFVSMFGVWLVPLPDALAMLVVEMMAGAFIGKLRVLGRQLRRGERRFRALTSELSDIVLVVDRNGEATYASESFRKLLNYDPAALLGSGYRRMFGERDEAIIRNKLARAIDTSEASDRFELALAGATGSARVFDVCATNYLGDHAVGGVVFSGRDISARKKAESLLRTQALHDSLTGLPNRAHFLACLEQEIGQIPTLGSVVVMFIDLNGFKAINDTFGHDMGDGFLREIGRRIESCVEDIGIAARLGGDEFAVLIPGKAAVEALLVAKRIVKVIGKPFVIEGVERTVGASIGIAATDQPVDSTTLLRRADALMYAAKRRRSGILVEGTDSLAAGSALR